MKRILLFSLAILGIQVSILAQCTNLPIAIPSVNLISANQVGNGIAVAYNPNLNLYYTGSGAGPDMNIVTYDNSGMELSVGIDCNWDFRGLWWNPNLNTLESNQYCGGVNTFDLDGSGYALNTNTTLLASNQPDCQSKGTYDYDANEILYQNYGDIYRIDHSTGGSISSYTITGLPVASSNLDPYFLGYTGCPGKELVVYDIVLLKAYFIDKATGAYVGTTDLPAAVAGVQWYDLNYANGQMFFRISSGATWYGYNLFGSSNTEIDVKGNSISIVDGDNTPAVADNTNFGTTNCSTNLVKTYYIHNTGTDDLTLLGAPAVSIGGANAGDFSVTSLPSTTIVPGDSADFEITFSSSFLGLRSANISILNNDADESSYNFDIQATVIDTTGPVFSLCPSNITMDADSGECSAVVTFADPEASDACGSAGGEAYYIRSNAVGGEPWADNSNIAAMDAVYGAGNWNSEYFETANVGTVFSSTTKMVFLEGSDAHADELNVFLAANLTTMESWVNDGGILFINAAPNEGGNIDYGFGGTTLNYSYPTTACDGPVDAVTPTHPIFIGPYTPVVTSYSGTSFSHSSITGTGLTDLLQGCSQIQLATKAWGSGNVFFGGMTTTNWHSPMPDAQNLRQNIIHYIDGLYVGSTTTITQTAGLPSGSTFPVGVTVNTFEATDDNGNSSICSFTVTVTDQEAPIADAPSLPTLTGCSVTVEIAPTAIDSCSGSIYGTTSDPLTYSTPGNYTITWTYDDGNGNTTTQTQSVNVIDCSGIEDETNVSFKLYPNPSNGVFTLTLSELPTGGAQIRVLDELGKVLYTNEMMELTHSYDFSYLSAATYYIQIISNDVNVTKTLIITNQQ